MGHTRDKVSGDDLHTRKEITNMSYNYHILYQSGLFGGISEQDLELMLKCLNARTASYRKNEIIYQHGDVIQEAGIVLEGKVHLEQHDFWGNCNILSVMQAGETFGAMYACLGNEKLQADIRAESNCQILFLNLKRTMHMCQNTCTFHQKLVENLVYFISRKNLKLMEKMQHISKRSIREKVLSYLSEESQKCESSYFTIPLTRQQMADYLAVDRSALSKELAKMKQEGLIEFEKNQFRLY